MTHEEKTRLDDILERKWDEYSDKCTEVNEEIESSHITLLTQYIDDNVNIEFKKKHTKKVASILRSLVYERCYDQQEKDDNLFIIKTIAPIVDKYFKMREQDQNKRKLKAVLKGLGEIVWNTLLVVFAGVMGFLMGIMLIVKMKGGC